MELQSVICKGLKMFNTYAMDAEICPECDALELIYLINCDAVHCQNCGTWFDTEKNILDTED